MKPERHAADQVYQQGPRSFAYIDADKVKNPDYILAVTETATATAKGDEIILKHGRSEEEKAAGAGEALIAHKVPQEGLFVWDADVGHDGKVKEVHVPGHGKERAIHVGHKVVDLEVVDPDKKSSRRWITMRS